MAQAPEPPKPGLELLARFTVELSAPVWDLGATSDLGTRRIVPITGGRIEGPRLAGAALRLAQLIDRGRLRTAAGRRSRLRRLPGHLRSI